MQLPVVIELHSTCHKIARSIVREDDFCDMSFRQNLQVLPAGGEAEIAL